MAKTTAHSSTTFVVFIICCCLHVSAFSSTAPRATLEDYTHFHGMLCGPRTASRCVRSFTGNVLFIPKGNHTADDLERYDCTDGVMSVISYYLLVLASMMGLCTLFRLTQFLVAKENDMVQPRVDQRELVAPVDKELVVDTTVMEYCKAKTQSKYLYLKRQFEYNARILGLSVMMVHFECDKKLLHLVEVYRFKNIVSRILFGNVFNFMGFVLHKIRRLKRLVTKS